MRIDELQIRRQFLHPDKSLDLIVRLNIQEVLDRTTLRVLCALRYLINLQPIALALRGKEQQCRVHRGRIDILDEILVACLRTLGADTTTALCPELAQRCPLDISHMRNGDDHLIIRIKVFRIQLLGSVNDIGLSLVAILLLDLQQLVLDHLHTQVVVFQDLLQIGDQFLDLLIFRTQLVLLQASQLAQAHLDNGTRLNIRKRETLHQTLDRVLRTL